MIVRECFFAIALVSGGPALANDGELETATQRLGACVTSGAAGAPRANLATAVSAVRVLCTPQIDAVRDLRVRDATRGLSQAEAGRIAGATERAINDEIAVTVSRLTGLTG